ncbi:MAG: hypothetical protein KAS59_10230 [Alphaproteobacteria bacterium]|nr:hypothetical protein [Alphaproteobacteria bacterium]
MLFDIGDILYFYSPHAGYPKYHLCVLKIINDDAAKFLYLNSNNGFAADFIVSDTEIPCLPPSKTGKSIISCSQLILANKRQLKLYKVKKIGRLDKKIAARLLKFVKTTDALSNTDKKIVTNALSKIN